MTADALRKRALIIDDDDDIREVLQTLLETVGFEVDTLRDGIEAVELKDDYDVILLDMKMPIFDGACLADYWKLTTPAILRRVILLTGYSRMSADRDFGTFARINKPFNHDHVLKTVEACSRQAPEGFLKTDADKSG